MTNEVTNRTDQEFNLANQARSIPREQRGKYLCEILETDLHRHLVSLFTRAEEKVRAEITHGPDEYGRDIVLRRQDPYGEEYLGVVVKRSPYKKLSGRQAGPIDELISQAKQAVTHKCLLKEISSETVDISTVWIAFFGRMSNNAAIRLKEETRDIRGRRIITLDHLVDLFTDHYPEVFFEGSVSEYLTDKIVEYESWSGIAKHRSKLSDWFVNPMVTIADSKIDVTEEDISFVYGNQQLPFGRLDEYIKPGAKLVLTGDPGSGKSTALRKVAIDMLKESQQATLSTTPSNSKARDIRPVPIPVLIDAVSARGKKQISDLLEAELPPLEIFDRFRIGLILLDGLDEVARESRDRILQDVFELSDEHNCCLIISSRKVPSLQIDIVGQARSPVRAFDILPFELSQALELIKKITTDSDLMSILREGLVRVSNQIVFTPIALELLIEIAESEREIPGSISEIFDRYTDIALGRYDSQKGIQVVFDYFTKKRFLSELAWEEFKNKERLEISRPDFDKFVASYIETYGWSAESFNALIAEIERSGILRLGKSVYFAHRSFLEFFVAQWTVQNPLDGKAHDQLLVDLYFDAMWSEVAIYAVGQKRMVSESVVRKILDYEASGLEHNLMKFMIGRLLQAAWHSASAVKLTAIEGGSKAGESLFTHIEAIREKQGDSVPAVVPFFFLMLFGEYAYGSRTLLNETTAVLSKLESDSSKIGFLRRLTLLWAIRDRCDPQTLATLVDVALEHLAVLEKEDVLSLEHRMASLFFLEQLSLEDTAAMKAIRRRSRRLINRNPQLARRVFPTRDGVRQSKKGRKRQSVPRMVKRS